MAVPSAAPQGQRPGAVPPEPVPMALAEKLAAEWEARHDVAARGRIGDVAAVQHYLTHTRCEQNRRTALPHADRPPSTGARRERAGLLGQWLRWGEDR